MVWFSSFSFLHHGLHSTCTNHLRVLLLINNAYCRHTYALSAFFTWLRVLYCHTTHHMVIDISIRVTYLHIQLTLHMPASHFHEALQLSHSNHTIILFSEAIHAMFNMGRTWCRKTEFIPAVSSLPQNWNHIFIRINHTITRRLQTSPQDAIFYFATIYSPHRDCTTSLI